MTLSPIPREKVFAVLKEQGRIDSFTRLAATFLQHFKDSRLSFPDIAPTGLVPTAGLGAGASVPDREARGPRRDLVANPARESVRRSQRTGPDRFVHALGGDLPAALQGQPAVLSRHRADWAGAHRDPGRAQAFLAVFRPIFERYQEALRSSGEIDFHDMINRATDLVEAGRYRSPFGYILVDEFQDISPSRAKLLKALLDRSPGAQLFAVGDDWQAIYRFGGSDIAVMREFGEHFGAFERIDLETTFRCSDRSRGRHRFRAAQPRANPQDGPRNAQGGPTGRAYWSSGRAGSIAAEGSARPDRRGCPPTRWDIRGAAARPLPASETPKHRRSGKAVSGSPLLLDDRAARRGSKATTRWCSACVAANTGFPPRLSTIRCWSWCCPRPKPIRMPRSGACSTSPSPA